MNEILLPTLLAFVGGVVGGGGLITSLFLHLMRKREAAQVARIDRVVERKAELYRRCAAFLRGLRSTNSTEAFDQLNSLADEMMLWSSNEVYHKFSALARQSFADPSGKRGGDMIEMIFPTLEAMAKDINPSVRLRPQDIIWHATFISRDAEPLWGAAFNHPEEFDSVTTLIRRNTATMQDILRHRLGDYNTVKSAVLNNIDERLNRPAPPDEPLSRHDADAVLVALTMHPSDNTLEFGHVTGYTGLSDRDAERYLRVLVQAGLVETARNTNGRPFYWLSETGKERLVPLIGREAVEAQGQKGIKRWLAQHGEDGEG